MNLPRVPRPPHDHPPGPRDPSAIPGQEERTGELPLDEARGRPVVVLHALEVDAQPGRAVTGAVSGVPLDAFDAVRDAADAAGEAAEFPSSASVHVSEATPQGFGVVGGYGHERGSCVSGWRTVAEHRGARGVVSSWRSAAAVSPWPSTEPGLRSADDGVGSIVTALIGKSLSSLSEHCHPTERSLT